MTAPPPAPPLVGATEARIHTAPLREIGPATSLGDECARFGGGVLGITLDRWQRWALDHALEKREEDGGLRFRLVLLLVARQNGKTELLCVIILWAMFTGRARLVLGVAQNLAQANELWRKTVALCESLPHLRREVACVRRANGSQELRLRNGARYVIAAANRSAGRGLSVDLLVCDEYRFMSPEAWASLSATTSARPDALTLCASNQGDSTSEVMDAVREAALNGTDPTACLLEYSAPDGCALDDPDGICAANPSLGHGRLTLRAIESARATDPPSVYRVERLCQKVVALDDAIDLTAWRGCADADGSLADHRDRLAACVDVSLANGHVALLVAAVLPDGRIRVEVPKSWPTTEAARTELPALLDRLNARVEAWFPSGPAAALAPLLRARKRSRELTGGDVSEACMGLADLVRGRRILHPADPLLDAHISNAVKARRSDGFVFARRGALGNVNAAYACAGAVLAAQSLPAPRASWGRLVPDNEGAPA